MGESLSTGPVKIFFCLKIVGMYSINCQRHPWIFSDFFELESFDSYTIYIQYNLILVNLQRENSDQVIEWSDSYVCQFVPRYIKNTRLQRVKWFQQSPSDQLPARVSLGW